MKSSFNRSYQLLRHQSTITKRISEDVKSKNGLLPNILSPPKYTLVTLKSFPSLEPLSCVPISTLFLNKPLRRDILWRAVVYENDNRRVGASNPPGRSDNGYSRKKLRPQKGTGHARVGDANSPTRHNGGRALARSAPNDYSTELPDKVYSLAFQTAFTYQYKKGNLLIIGNEGKRVEKLDKNDVEYLDIVPPKDVSLSKKHISLYFKKFLNEFNLQNQNLLFITNEVRENLIKYSEPYKRRVDILQWQGLEVNDILKANKIFVEFGAFKKLMKVHTR